MTFLNIQVNYMDNLNRKKLPVFQVPKDPLNTHILISKIQDMLQPLLREQFTVDKLYYVFNSRLVKFQIDSNVISYVDDKQVTFLYSEIKALHNANHIAVCSGKNGEKIYFDIFPREQNHRFLPHVMAECRNETIRITLKEPIRLLGGEEFTGNNRKNQKIAIQHVIDNRDDLLKAWNDIVEIQFS